MRVVIDMAVDLEHFPTSATAQRMMSRVSPIYDRSYVAKWLYQVMGQEWDQVWKVMESLWEQPFLDQATWGLHYWEEAYGLATDESKSCEERRRLVSVKRNERAPMSPARLESILSALSGCAVSVTENIAPYTFQVTLVVPSASRIDHVLVLRKIRALKPSHLSAVYHARLPAMEVPLRIGAAGGIQTRRPPTEQPDNLYASHTLRAGGRAALQARLPPVPQPDGLRGADTLRAAVHAMASARLPPTEQPDAPPRPGAIRQGGTGAVISTLRGRLI
ncbi:MAG: DUF2313 domain-containing protein [Oscillibacter sp.]|nr:DUF2313 domain-containing protein [Oscillibacter sp.]